MKRTSAITLKLSLAALLLVFCICCKKKSQSPEDETNSQGEAFDKQGMLVNMADQLIVPCYAEFKTALDSLTLSYANFASSGTQSDFSLVKLKLHVAYLRYQRISLLGFGPGEDLNIRANFNVFPASVSLINSNISSGNYNLGQISNMSAKGFPALDYLFYGHNKTEAEQLQLFTTDNNRKKYVNDLLNDMSSKANAVLTAWNATYRATFVNSLRTDVGSSIGFLVNQLNYELDYLKNFKLAVPLGLKSAGEVMPDNCEAYYGGQSVQYALETLSSIENLYLGRSFAGSDGKGFDDYLDHLGIQRAGTSLNAAIKDQFATARARLNAIGNPLSDKVVSDPGPVNTAYKELVKLLVLLKTDMPSSLGVVITYQDGDGD